MDEVAVLVLNHTFEPLHFTNARRAITLLLAGKAESVEGSPRVLRLPACAVPLPAWSVSAPLQVRFPAPHAEPPPRALVAGFVANVPGRGPHAVLTARPAAFRLSSEYEPRGDQPRAIEALTRLVVDGRRHTVLRGVTGSGKTYTIANLIANTGRPTLVLSPNKTLAAQLFSEFKAVFPDNAIEYFVSYYDYYQPEAYIPQSDTYIEKDALINDEIDRM